MTLRAPKYVIGALSRALKAAKCERADFGSHNIMSDKGFKVTRDKFVKEAIELHHETYVIPEIEKALRWALGLKSEDCLDNPSKEA